MGKRGPKPKPKAIRMLEGNPGRLNVVGDDYEITSELPAVMPPQVEADEIASAEWRRLMAAMPPNLYCAADTVVITMYAMSYALMLRAQIEIDLNGVLVMEDGKLKANPAVKVWKASTENLFKCADRLGLNPGVRARMQIPARGDHPATKFGNLITEN
jgi:P27 family predicted phage terminase small subunit